MTLASTHPSARPRTRLQVAVQHAAFQYVLALFFFAAVIVIIFHGVLFAPNSTVLFGFSDATGQLRDYWATAAVHKTPFTLTRDLMNGAPEGRPLAPAVQVANFFQPATVWVLKGSLGLVGAWNTFLFAGFLATAMAAFAFLKYLGCTFGAALFGGYVTSFNPWAIERSFAGHIAFLHNWVFLLLIVLLLATRKRRSVPSALSVGVGIAICFYMAAYDGLFGSFIVAVFGVVELFRLPADRRRTVLLTVSAYAFSVVLLLPVLVMYARDQTVVQSQADHPVSQLNSYGAVPLAYVIPAARNPVFGFMHRIHPTDFTEQTLFFGYTTMILAAVCVLLFWRRDPWLRAPSRRWTLIFFAWLVPAAFVMSLPRTYSIGPLTLPMPSWVITHFTTFWRVYARFGVIVGLALTVLAALALTALANRDRRWHLLAPLALATIACLEFLPGHVVAFNMTKSPPYSQWLARHPGGIVANYPPALDQDPGTQLSAQDFSYQRIDRHPRFAFFGSGTIDTYANAIRLLSRYVTDPLSPGILATEGVRYVVLHDDVYKAQHQVPPTPDKRYFKLVARFPSTRIYTVSAPRVDLKQVVFSHNLEIAQVEGLRAPDLEYGSGFNPPENYQGTMRRWLITDGQLKLNNGRGRVSQVTLTGLAFSNDSPHLLSLKDSTGRILAQATVPKSEVPLNLGPFKIPRGAFTLTLSASPPAVKLGGNDPRFASVFLSPLQLQPIPVYPDAP